MKSFKTALAVLTCGVMMFGMDKMANATPVQWGVNGNYYDIVFYTGTWDQANADVQNKNHNGINGHLATITSADENKFVFDNFTSIMEGSWLGGYQYDKLAEPVGHWAWVTGETWSYSNFTSGEPNNAWGDEDHINIWSNGSWNDQHNNAAFSKYVVEYEAQHEPAPVPEPATALLIGAGLVFLVGARRKKQYK